MEENTKNELLEELRDTTLGMTQRQLSEALGCSRQKIRNIVETLEEKSMVDVYELGNAKLHRINEGGSE